MSDMEKAGSTLEQLTPAVLVVSGKDLSLEDLETINTHRKAEFNSSTPIVATPENENWDKPYFLLRGGKELLAFGRLHDVEVQFQGKDYPILGIATIIAIKKGEGHGKLLMTKMKEYIEATGKTAIGFCDPAMAAFYEKSGYSIIKGGVQRVTYMESGSEVPVPESRAQGDVIYLPGKDDLILRIQEHPEEKLTAFRAPW